MACTFVSDVKEKLNAFVFAGREIFPVEPSIVPMLVAGFCASISIPPSFVSVILTSVTW